MKCMMNPSTALLNTNHWPFVFEKKAILGEKFCHFKRKYHMPVLIDIIKVFLRVLNLILRTELDIEKCYGLFDFRKAMRKKIGS